MPERTQPPRVLLLSAVGTRINPYIGLLREGLAAAGADVRLATQLDPADLAPDRRPDVIHLHWLERYDLPPMIVATGLRGATDLPRRALRRAIETRSQSARDLPGAAAAAAAAAVRPVDCVPGGRRTRRLHRA